MSSFSAFRYFWLVSSPRVYFLVAFAALALMGIVLEFVFRGSSDFATTMILVVQMFAVSTGFSVHASRGYFDPVLTARSRSACAAAHFASSALPGLIAWSVLAAAQVMRAGTVDVVALRLNSIVGLFLISTVCWALTLPFPPLSAGGAWLLISIGFVVSGRFVATLAPAARDPRWFQGDSGRALLVGLVYPIMLPGMALPALSIAALAAIAILAFGGGVLFVRRHDVPLAEEA